ncbi:hypothetical protein [Catenuloplanes atrovinosus]|uniref:hypothetical protein n=1 Tax=Catenuloplanes atrovinosus TaxID=137266 RepID=UPI00286CB539|nr:hypothetical protein [Catenuloplanes atrovinosus]
MCVRKTPPHQGGSSTVPTLETDLTPYATMLSFTRYVGRTGPKKASFVSGLRRARQTKSGFNPHGQLVKALKADIQFRTPGTHLAAVVQAVKPRWRPLYEASTAGAARYLETLGDLDKVWLAQTRDALAVIGGLPVKINPHLGLRYEGGRAEAVRLHFDETPPGDEAVVATLHLMAAHMDQILPHAEPVLVDVRRGAVFRADPATRPADIDRWLTGEAAAFAAMWSAAS